VIPPTVLPGAYHVFHQYIIRAPKRDALQQHLTAREIGCNVFYPKALHLQACFADLGYKAGDFPHAEAATACVLALPIFPELTDAQAQRVADEVLAFYR
jgi:dTDP-4-amino-4,6-dideoxygalactose transaminase